MARCHVCNEYLGLGFFSKWVTMGGSRFCHSCGPQWAEQRKLQVIEELLREPSAQPVFTIHRMWTRNPDGPHTRERLLGATAFLDKGICFAHFGSYTEVNEWLQIFAALFLHITDDRQGQRRAEFERINSEARLTDDRLFEALREAQGVLFYPLSDISKLSQDGKGFTIHFGKKRKRFAWDGGGKTRKKYRQLLEAYNEAVRTRTDPTVLCRAVR